VNPLLQIKMPFLSENSPNRPNGRNLRSGKETSASKIDGLIEDLNAILRYYKDVGKVTRDVLVDVNYNDIVAKSNRISELLKPTGGEANDKVVGARFSEGKNHVITHYVSENVVLMTIGKLKCAKGFVSEELSGKATVDNFNEPKNKIRYSGHGLSKTQIRNVVVDCSFVDSFSIPNVMDAPSKDAFLVTFYKTELHLSNLLEKLGIDRMRYPYDYYGDDTLSVHRNLFDVLSSKVPYLISMISGDLSQISLDEIDEVPLKAGISIPSPHDEPVIGVIDTLFDENAYFHEWVQSTDYLEDVERLSLRNPLRSHGTEVDSIIVDGPRLNPNLDDGCGRFRVRHFGICERKISTARLVGKVCDIVSQNPDIHVWNLSLGTEDEVSNNFISFDAAALDELQANHNIVFVVSGTNDNRSVRQGSLRIGSPADSLNSIIVNSVRRDGKMASYSRRGNVLSFFNKPDVSYYGGDEGEEIVVCSSHGVERRHGTSYAAPWISRKICFLIDVMGLSREVAKALIIDSAAGWDCKGKPLEEREFVGYGIVPIKIEDVLKTRNDEFRFAVHGTSKAYRTSNYQIPIPRDEDGKYPYIARATLCYFPECSRRQGVDYTNRELSIKFGRVDSENRIKDINHNVQDSPNSYVDERRSRTEFRKWENTKFISKDLTGKSKALKSYGDNSWGISITSKERLSSKMDKGLTFGFVVTMRDLGGANRIQEFIRLCTIRGWIVNNLEIENRVSLYNKNQANIEFDE